MSYRPYRNTRRYAERQNDMHFELQSERMKICGKRIRAMRLRAGLTQRKFGAQIGIDNTYLSKIENGHASPSADFLAIIARALDGNPVELMRLAGKIPPNLDEAFCRLPALYEIVKRSESLDDEACAQLNQKLESLAPRVAALREAKAQGKAR